MWSPRPRLDEELESPQFGRTGRGTPRQTRAGSGPPIDDPPSASMQRGGPPSFSTQLPESRRPNSGRSRRESEQGRGRAGTGQVSAQETTPLMRTKLTTDPVVGMANKKVGGSAIFTGLQVPREDDISTPELAMRSLVLVLPPVALYTFTLLAVVFFYDDWPMWVFTAFFLTVLKSYLVARFFKNSRWQGYLGLLLGMATTVGMVAGLIAYYRALVFYDHYRDATVHVNVAANEDALRFSHSGLLSFTPDSRVDASRSVGFQSLKKDVRICVAPVVDSTMAPTDPVSFFAVGTDCCEWREGFRCDDASDGGAHGGALKLFLSGLVSSTTAWLFEDSTLENDLRSAVELQHAVYSTVLSNNTRLLRWVRDPAAIKDGYKNAAVLGLTLWSVFFVLALVAGAVAAAAGRHNVRKVMRKGRDTLDMDDGDHIVHTKARPGRVRTDDWFFQFL